MITAASTRTIAIALPGNASSLSPRSSCTIQQRYHGAAMGTEAVRFLVLWMAGWIHSRQLEVIDFLREENRVLREQLGGRRLRFTDDQRRRLADLNSVAERFVLSIKSECLSKLVPLVNTTCGERCRST
jgi:hypothetical protein